MLHDPSPTLKTPDLSNYDDMRHQDGGRGDGFSIGIFHLYIEQFLHSLAPIKSESQEAKAETRGILDGPGPVKAGGLVHTQRRSGRETGRKRERRSHPIRRKNRCFRTRD